MNDNHLPMIKVNRKMLQFFGLKSTDEFARMMNDPEMSKLEHLANQYDLDDRVMRNKASLEKYGLWTEVEKRLRTRKDSIKNRFEQGTQQRRNTFIEEIAKTEQIRLLVAERFMLYDALKIRERGMKASF